jgi:hypothetical protein
MLSLFAPLSACVPAATLALIGGGAFALTKLDEGFLEYMDEASCKVREGALLGFCKGFLRFW